MLLKRRLVQYLLHQVDIEKPSKFSTRLFRRADKNKTKRLIEMNAGTTVFGHADNQSMKLKPPGLVDLLSL